MKIENITKKYDSKTIIENFYLEISDNSITCIFGESGCGKTTLLNIVLGLVDGYEGEIHNCNKNISAVFQENRLLPWINVLNNVIIVADKNETTDKSSEKAKYILENLGLGNDMLKYPHELSGGMKQRVNIARALMFPFDMIIMDEPFKGLDFITKVKTIEFIKSYIGKAPVLFISHDVEEVLSFAQRVVAVKGTPLEVKCIFNLDNTDEVIKFKEYVFGNKDA